MGINYNFSKGNDFPVWQWLPFCNAPIYGGFDSDYDGVRYIYCVGQQGVTSTSASTSQLWRFDTWGHGWQYLASVTSGNRGMSLTYDDVRNILIITHGAGLASWQIFNLNQTSINICGVACASWTIQTMTPVLPALAEYGATVLTINPNATPAIIEEGLVGSGCTSTIITNESLDSAFTDFMVGLQIKITSGTCAGQKSYITSVTNQNTLVVGTAFSGTPSKDDAYIIETPNGTATSATVSTLVESGVLWTVNQYSNCDCLIVSGTGAGQKRRIASNTATTLTLATAVTGNANTGNWSIVPDTTSIFKIQMSSDFLYYTAGSTGTGFYKIDLATGASAPTWTTLTATTASLSGGGNLMWADSVGSFQLLVMRGNATATFYCYNVGLNSWSTLATKCGAETFTTGASSSIWDGQRKLIIQKEGTTRLYALNLATRELEPLATIPYANPSAYDGHRLRVVTTPDKAQWLYVQRNGGAEFFRVPLEWGQF